jgi:hypothetical protein
VRTDVLVVVETPVVDVGEAAPRGEDDDEHPATAKKMIDTPTDIALTLRADRDTFGHFWRTPDLSTRR